MRRPPSAYKALLRCYPAAFREEYGRQMLLAFSDQLDDSHHRTQQAALWMHAASDAFTIAPKEHFHVIAQDIRYSLRTMTARPGFTAVAILSLALGIGANTAIFSLWNGLLNTPLPAVVRPEQLVMLTDPDSSGAWHGNSQGEREWLTYSEFVDLRVHATSFSAMMASESALDRWPLHFEGRDFEEARGRLVSANYFQFLGMRPILGRVFTADDDRAEAPYAVISYNYWQRRFGGRPDALGKSFTLRRAVLTIIGIAPRDFIGETVGQQPDLWAPVRMQSSVIPGEDWLHDTPPEKIMWLHVFGRLKPGVTAARAGAEANTIFKAGLESFYAGVTSPDQRRDYLDQRLTVRAAASGAGPIRSDFSTSLTVLLAAVGVLLLIACANLANLLLARGAARKAEMALRLSLGASRGRLIRQMVTESLVLAALGGIAGLTAAWFLHATLVHLIMQSDRSFRMEFALDPVVLAFTLAVTLTAGILFGLLPAWQATRTDAAATLKQQGRGTTGSPGRFTWGRSLVSLQLALSLPLLVGAGLLARTVYNLQHVDVGFPTENLFLVGIDSRVAGYNSTRSGALFRDLLARIQRIPGVKSASFSHNGVFTGSNSGDSVEVEGFTPKTDDDKGSAWDMVGPGYFSTLGVPLLLGREILETDQAGSPKVCVINDAFAKHFFAGRNPVGMHISLIDEGPGGNQRTTYQIVGVARNARTNGLRNKTIPPRVFEPISQAHGDNVKRANFLIRTSAANSPVLSSVRQAFRAADQSLPILYARSMEDQIAPSTAPDRATAQVAAVFGCAALLLAAIGLYGVLSYSIVRRKTEIAIRIALGAQPGTVIGMVLRETTALVEAGLAAGAALTYAALRFIANQLYGIAPQDPLTLTAAIALLLVVALAAVYLPARRASRLDPSTALRGVE